MLFFIRTNVTIRVEGISGLFTRTVSWLVNADNPDQAKFKYEQQVRKDFAHMNFAEVTFEYTEFAGEIK